MKNMIRPFHYLNIGKILCIGFMMTLLSGCSDEPIGIIDGKLAPCPDWLPRCVNSFSNQDQKSYVEPIHYESCDNINILDAIVTVVDSMERTKLIKRTDNYLHFQFTSRLMKFVDNVEFYITDGNTIHIRSSSIVGYYDNGVNRKRYSEIKEKLEEYLSNQECIIMKESECE